MKFELDGKHHFTKDGLEKDKERDEHLALLNKKALRFENKEILNNLTDVLKKNLISLGSIPRPLGRTF